MLEKISFKNKDSNNEIELSLDKKMIFVYGKNGSGKTTMSRSFYEAEKCYIFNEDFIYKNVYIIQNDGAKTDQTTKNNFSELLIGEEEILIKKEITELEELNKEQEVKLKNRFLDINSVLLKNMLNESDNILKDMVDDKLMYKFEESIEEAQKNYSYKSALIQTIKNEDELQLKIKQLNKQENLADLNNKINDNLLLKAYLYNDEEIINAINEEILEVKSYNKTISELEQFAKKKNVDGKYFDTIAKCLEIQKETGLDKCFLCGTENVKDNIFEWNKIIHDKTIDARDRLKKNIQLSIDAASIILDSRKVYEPVAPRTVKYIEAYANAMIKILQGIDDKTYKTISVDKCELDSAIVEVKEIKESIRNFLLIPFEKDVVFLNSMKKIITDKIKTQKDILDQILTRNSDANEKSINSILSDLGLNKEMTITIDRYGGKPKYRIDLKNGTINTLSDGQKHKLALAIFLNYIKSNKLDRDSIVVFDDPVVSLDESGYHLFKNYLIRHVMKEQLDESPKLIILTHNFSYLYIQISNIILKESLRNNSVIYKLTENGTNILDFHYFELDDIAFFKECLSKIKYKFQLNDLSTIYLKMFRIFLDLSLRIRGEPDTLDVSVEIRKLGLHTNLEDRLKFIHENLCAISKRKNIDFDKSVKVLKLLKEAIEILGFNYITDENINNAEKLEDKDEYYDNDIFFILKEVANVIINKKEQHYVNYLNHPRISFTQNILSSSMNV